MAQKNSSKSEKSKSSKNKKKTNFFTVGCVVLGLFIIVIVFLANKNKIVGNYKDTDFFGRVFGSTPQFIENHESEPQKTSSKKDDQIVIKIEEESAVVADDEIVIPLVSESSKNDGANSSANVAQNSQQNSSSQNSAASQPEQKNSQTASQNQNVKTETSEKKSSSSEQKSAGTASSAKMEIQLCFVMIDGDGSVVRKIVKRNVAKTDSPLTYAINELLKGPSASLSSEKNLSTLIPKGTKLLSAKVQNKVAYLDFNQAFEFNEIGIEGYIHQLEQIVYTATAFSTVESVQFLIEGKKIEYLAEAQWIGSPLSRKSF